MCLGVSIEGAGFNSPAFSSPAVERADGRADLAPNAETSQTTLFPESPSDPHWLPPRDGAPGGVTADCAALS